MRTGLFQYGFFNRFFYHQELKSKTYKETYQQHYKYNMHHIDPSRIRYENLKYVSANVYYESCDQRLPTLFYISTVH